MGDTFRWVGAVTGAWGTASNWEDTTTGQGATIAPGSLDEAFVNGSLTQFLTIAGPGSAASLSLFGETAVTGTINAGALDVGSGALDIGAGTTVIADSAVVYSQPAPGVFAGADITVSGSGAALTVTGTLALGVVGGGGQASDLIASAGAMVSAGSLLMADGSDIQVDGTSTIEIGTGGSAAAGSLTLDAGATITVSGFDDTIAPNVADNGTIAVAAESSFDLLGTLTGSGQVSVGDDGSVVSAAIAAGGPLITLGSNAEALMDGAVGAGSTIAMAGTSDVLSLRNVAAFAGTVSGFDQTDTLVVNGTITSAVYTAGAGTTGTLALFDAATQVGSVTLIGDYTGVTFQPAPTGNPATTEIVFSTSVPVGQEFRWVGAVSENWGTASNWFDVSTGLPATIAPGSLDTAFVNGSLTQFLTIAGPGSAASLSVGGDIAVTGTINAGALSVDAGTLDIGAGTTVIADSAVVFSPQAPGVFTGADITVSGSGAALTVTGTLALGVVLGGGEPSDLIASAGGMVGAGSLLMGDDAGIQADSASAIEIGAGGSAVAGRLTVDAGATITVSGFDDTIAPNVADGGTIAVAAGSGLDLLGTLSGSGQVSVGDDGGVESAAIAAGGPLVTLASDAEAQIDGAVGVGSTIAMAGTTDVLRLGSVGAFAGAVSGFDQTDTLIVNGTITSAVYTAGTGATGTLALFDAATQVGAVTLIGDYTGIPFLPVSTSYRGTTGIVLEGTAPCFAEGTHIATDRGDVAVEALRVGDRVWTVLDKDMQEIVWIGHRRADCTRHPRPKAIWPVRISAGAFGAGRPSRDLFLSPDHSVYANKVLIPVKYLINGTTIVQVPMDEVAYFHLLLPRHEVLLAEGLTVESYLDTGDRADFANGGVSIALHPELAPLFWEALGCAPLMVVGPEVTAVQHLLAARARQIARAARRPGRQGGKSNGTIAVARRAGGLAA